MVGTTSDEYENDNLPFPIPIDFLGGGTQAVLLFSSANFYRTVLNTNINITAPLGVDISPGLIYFSPDCYLPVNTFNSTKPITEVIFPDSNQTLILFDSKYMHDIMIQYKLTKEDNTNYTNNREVRATLVNSTGGIYDASIYANSQPNPGAHDILHIKGYVEHNVNDAIRIKLNVVQDTTRSDTSSSKITILRISWNILGLKNE